MVRIDLPATAQPGEALAGEITLLNTGVLTWSRRGKTNRDWPILRLGCHLLDADGGIVDFDYHRLPLPRRVRPGEQVTFVFAFAAPATPGHYLVEWDMVSEHECWFAQCGGEVACAPLQVRSQAAVNCERHPTRRAARATLLLTRRRRA